MAVAAPGRSADGDEHRLGLPDALGQLAGEFQPPAFDVRLDQRLQPGLPDRHHPGPDLGDLGRVLVDAGHVMAEIGQARPGNEADVAGADHRDMHGSIPQRTESAALASAGPQRQPPLARPRHARHHPPMQQPKRKKLRPPTPRLPDDLAHMTLRRKSALNEWQQIGVRILLMMGALTFIIAFHWFERHGLRDNYDGHVSFSDVIYFTMISATTTGYGDVVPITDQARLFDAVIVTPIRIFFILILAGTAYTFFIKRTWHRYLMRRIQTKLCDHIVVCGYGTSGTQTVDELIARGTDPRNIVVVDPNGAALVRAEDLGCAAMQADATKA